ELKKEQDPERKEQIKSALTRLKHQIESFKESEKKQDLSNKLKKIANDDAKEGKKPHFVNKSEQKILVLAEKYKELKKSGKIEQFLAKKRKKQLSKEKKNFYTKHLRFV
ncbi:ribosomal RNA processing 36 -like protein, partial [Brachionus plicatilis]